MKNAVPGDPETKSASQSHKELHYLPTPKQQSKQSPFHFTVIILAINLKSLLLLESNGTISLLILKNVYMPQYFVLNVVHK